MRALRVNRVLASRRRSAASAGSFPGQRPVTRNRSQATQKTLSKQQRTKCGQQERQDPAGRKGGGGSNMTDAQGTPNIELRGIGGRWPGFQKCPSHPRLSNQTASNDHADGGDNVQSRQVRRMRWYRAKARARCAMAGLTVREWDASRVESASRNAWTKVSVVV